MRLGYARVVENDCQRRLQLAHIRRPVIVADGIFDVILLIIDERLYARFAVRFLLLNCIGRIDAAKRGDDRRPLENRPLGRERRRIKHVYKRNKLYQRREKSRIHKLTIRKHLAHLRPVNGAYNRLVCVKQVGGNVAPHDDR